MKHVLRSQQFDRDMIEALFRDVTFMEQVTQCGRLNIFSGKIMACLFYEPSTRTRFSFQAAMARLGGHVLVTENAEAFSSAAKGERLIDTIRVTSGYCDVIVLRHRDEGSSELAAKHSSVPIINAGDGKGQHPTQSLLDLYTIQQQLGRLDNISVALVGDLKHGRTVHSLAYLLSKFNNVKLYLVAPPECPMKPEILDYLRTKGIAHEQTKNLDSVLPLVDCVYMTRVQKERFDSPAEYERVKDTYILTPENVRHMPGKSIILHPLPRLDEIHPDVDKNPRAKYFTQAQNGLYVRMALLRWVLDQKEHAPIIETH